MKSEENIHVIIKNYLQGKCSREELDNAIFYFNNPRLNQAIENLLNETWEKDQFNIPGEYETRRIPEILSRIHAKIEPELKELRRRKTRQLFINVSKVAAILVIGMFMGILVNTFKKEDSIVYTSMTPKGSISQVILPDSTMVYLNSDTELKFSYNSSKRRREVYLDGEAWFQVSENRKKPFVVSTNFYDVVVTGTEFNVKAYKEENLIVTTLESGSVVIPSTDKFRMKSSMVLAPGEQFLFDRESRSTTTQKVRTSYYSSWKENKLIFINMNLSDLIRLLERKFDVDIEVADKSILNYHYDGTIKNESILEIMDLIKVTMPIDYKVVGQKILITKKTGRAKK
ncbi:MAG: FecR family protein [Bacteroidales bacterium]|nr:FecR family protein [Bacteroidales bacterium]